MLRKIVLMLVAFAGSLLVLGLVGEGLVRAFLKEGTVMFPRYHTAAQYGEWRIRTIRPGSTFHHASRDGTWEFRTNARGFRDTRDFPYQKPAGTTRVLVLGDSHAQGYEARQDHTFSAVLERYLRHRGVAAEVINAGVSGFSTAEELVLLENEGYRYQPDYVVLAFFGNDYEDNLKAGLFGLDPAGNLTVLRKEHLPGVRAQDLLYRVPGARWLGENSYFYSLVFNNVWTYFKSRLARDRTLEYAVPGQDAVGDREVRLAGALLERMHAFCKERGITLVVLDVPTVQGDGVASSVVPALLPVVKRNSEVYLDSATTLAEEMGAVEIHVPHGHRHISEFTHLRFGIELGKVVCADRCPGRTAPPQ